MSNTLTLIRPDDWHLHVRQGDVLQAVIADTARQFKRAIIMPNLQPPVVNVDQALRYRDEILTAASTAMGPDHGFTPLMTLYLTDRTSPDDIAQAVDANAISAVKLYPAGATTNSSEGVTDLFGRCMPALEAMQTHGLPLLVHGEVTDPDVDIFDREAVFIDRVMIPLRKALPELKVVFEHLTTADGVDYVAHAEGPIGATKIGRAHV